MYKSICPKVFYDALRRENFLQTLNAFISKFHFENDSQDFSSITWPDFVQIYRAYLKKYYLVSQESFFEKKTVLLFTKNWCKMGWKFSKKFQTPAIFQKKRLLAHCFDSSKKIIICFDSRRIFWIISWPPQEALLQMDFQQKGHNSAIFLYFYFKIIWKLLQ